MKLVEYYKPKSIKEALVLLTRCGKKASVLAGGTDLIVNIRARKRNPTAVIDIKGIKNFYGIKLANNKIIIGALTTLSDIAKNKLLQEKLPVLPATALLMGSPQVRNRATIGGNLANAAPSADMAPPLIVLDAKAKIIGPRRRRTVPVEKFFIGPGKTVLQPNELLEKIVIPLWSENTKITYKRLTPREAMDLAIVSAAVLVEKHRSKIAKVRIALGAVAPTPIRVKTTEKFILKCMGEASLSMAQARRVTSPLPDWANIIEKAAELASREASPITDVRASIEYRKEMIKVVVRDALQEVLQ